MKLIKWFLGAGGFSNYGFEFSPANFKYMRADKALTLLFFWRPLAFALWAYSIILDNFINLVAARFKNV